MHMSSFKLLAACPLFSFAYAFTAQQRSRAIGGCITSTGNCLSSSTRWRSNGDRLTLRSDIRSRFSGWDIDDKATTPTTEDDIEGDDKCFDTIIIGAGAAGVGVAHALLKGGVDPKKILMLERGVGIGSSFREWHKTTQFISPSWPSHPFGQQDLNVVVPDTAVHGSDHPQHPSGDEYADYLERMMAKTGVVTAFRSSVSRIEKSQRDGLFYLTTKPGHFIRATNVVWCAGEWNSPRILGGDDFEEGTTVHYRYANLDDYQPNSEEDPVLVVGGGEAGADIACALAARNVHSKIIEAAENDDEQVDPSRKLSPTTEARLRQHREKISIAWGTKCTKTTTCDDDCDSIEVTLSRQKDGSSETVTTSKKVILCTGFNVKQNPVIRDLFEWNDNSPIVTPTYDESTKTPGLFLAGPMLMHNLQSCGCDDDGTLDPEDEGNNIIFCFVYKYRTRFGVLATKIIHRIIEDRFAEEEKKSILSPLKNVVSKNKKAMSGSDRPYADDMSDLKLTEEGQQFFLRLRKMQKLYHNRGMYLIDLNSPQLACGMATNDSPTYEEVASCEC